MKMDACPEAGPSRYGPHMGGTPPHDPYPPRNPRLHAEGPERQSKLSGSLGGFHGHGARALHHSLCFLFVQGLGVRAWRQLFLFVVSSLVFDFVFLHFVFLFLSFGFCF